MLNSIFLGAYVYVAGLLSWCPSYPVGVMKTDNYVFYSTASAPVLSHPGGFENDALALAREKALVNLKARDVKDREKQYIQGVEVVSSCVRKNIAYVTVKVSPRSRKQAKEVSEAIHLSLTRNPVSLP